MCPEFSHASNERGGVIWWPPFLGPSRRMGSFIKDVRTEGGEGVGPKADIVREVAWIYS